MAQIRVLGMAELPRGEKKTVKVGETEILLLHLDSGLVAVQGKCPHAGAPLEKGAVCNGRLVCPWHMGTFALPGGDLVEPPALEPLKTYAVRLVGQEIYVDPDPLPQAVKARSAASQHHTVLLAGVGAAGAVAAMTLRQGGFGGRIVAVDPLAEEPVDRTQLSKQALAGKMPLEKVGMNVLAALDVERVQASVISLSAAASAAHLSNGDPILFDSALVATGGRPKRLEISGAEFAHTIRHVDDVRRILAAAEGRQRAVIVGTSFIGLEAASALVQKGLQVTVVGREDLSFAKKFGNAAAQAVKALQESKGTRFRLGVEVAAISPAGVTIRADGKDELAPADLVIMGVGVEPDLGFTHDLPLASDGGGVRTDASLRAAGRVWVAGDIANVEGTRIEHWRLAEQHGRVAALAMLEAETELKAKAELKTKAESHAEAGAALTTVNPARYEGVPFFWTSHFGKRLGYLGHAEAWDEMVTQGDVAGLEFVTFYVQAGVVKAVLSCGRDTQTATLAELMRSELTLEEARRAID